MINNAVQGVGVMIIYVVQGVRGCDKFVFSLYR